MIVILFVLRKRYQKDSLAHMKNSGEIHEQLVTYDEEGGGEMDTNGYLFIYFQFLDDLIKGLFEEFAGWPLNCVRLSSSHSGRVVNKLKSYKKQRGNSQVHSQWRRQGF